MKLIYCLACRDIIKLVRKKRYCSCGKSFGRYIDKLNAEYGGDALPIGILEKVILEALKEVKPFYISQKKV